MPIPQQRQQPGQRPDVTAPYRGRFAPSPTGPLHLGSLLTALASWLQARQQGGTWLVRMEDLDRTRTRQAHADDILRTLEHHGLGWDESVLHQGTRDPAYAAACKSLANRGLLFACTCTRRELADSTPGIEGPIYPGTCRNAPALRLQPHALRIRVDDRIWQFDDAIQGRQSQCLSQAVGDFILRRSDGLFAYQLAVVVDDACQRVTEIVRGADLLASTPRQQYLQSLLGYPAIRYAHLPLLVDPAGDKLSKQNHADPVSRVRPQTTLTACLKLLGQQPPADLEDSSVDELLAWARDHWSLESVPRTPRLAVAAMA